MENYKLIEILDQFFMSNPVVVFNRMTLLTRNKADKPPQHPSAHQRRNPGAGRGVGERGWAGEHLTARHHWKDPQPREGE